MDDVVACLVQALDVPESADRIIEISGDDVLTHRDMFERYARPRGLERKVVPLPWIPDVVTTLWTSALTSVPASAIRALRAA